MVHRLKFMRLLKYTAGCILSVSCLCANAQITGGQYAFEYLRVANSPEVSSLGGISVANPAEDISLAAQNPALMRPGLHNLLELNYNDYYAGVKIMNLQYGYHMAKINTSCFFALQYFNYGVIDNTDASGNITGTFHPSDYALTLGASRKYLDHWRYGADIKYAHSGMYQASGAAAMVDVGVNYYDTSSLWDIGIVAKNMGVMVKKFNTALPSEPVPFDLQLGVSKKFKHLPLRLFATLHHLYEWDVRYSNPDDLNSTNALGKNDTVNDKGSHFGDKLFRHVIIGGEITFGKHVVVNISYNDLQRRELAVSTKPGLAGFALGLGVNLKKFQVHYARTYYHIAGPYNELGITMALNRLLGFGKWGDNHHWNSEYANWE
jgi:hypothetical protein